MSPEAYARAIAGIEKAVKANDGDGYTLTIHLRSGPTYHGCSMYPMDRSTVRADLLDIRTGTRPLYIDIEAIDAIELED